MIKKSELLEENRILKDRCRGYSMGYFCKFCNFECENRMQEYGAKEPLKKQDPGKKWGRAYD